MNMFIYYNYHLLGKDPMIYLLYGVSVKSSIVCYLYYCYVEYSSSYGDRYGVTFVHEFVKLPWIIRLSINDDSVESKVQE